MEDPPFALTSLPIIRSYFSLWTMRRIKKQSLDIFYLLVSNARIVFDLDDQGTHQLTTAPFY